MNPIDRFLFGSMPYVKTGTTAPIYLPKNDTSEPVTFGKGYFYVKVIAAQVAFKGAIFDRVERLVITSRVNLNHPKFEDGPVLGIQRTCGVEGDRAVQLGWANNIIAPVPTSMRTVRLSFDYVLDTRNTLSQLATLINSDTFSNTVSFAPGAIEVVKRVGPLAKALVDAFIPGNTSQPVLQFTGDFNLLGNDLKEGYYVILGSKDESNPLPKDVSTLALKGESNNVSVTLDGKDVTQLSYIVLEVKTAPYRGREFASVWDTKLQEAEGIAKDVANSPAPGGATDEEKREAWKKCSELIRDARALLNADYNYLPDETALILDGTSKKCGDLIRGTSTPRGVFETIPREMDMADVIPFIDVDEALIKAYSNQLEAAEKFVRGAK